MQLINYLNAKIIKIDESYVYIDIGGDDYLKWPKNKISDLNIFEGKEVKLIMGGEDILEEQNNIIYKKIIKEIVNDSQ